MRFPEIGKIYVVLCHRSQDACKARMILEKGRDQVCALQTVKIRFIANHTYVCLHPCKIRAN